MSDFQESQRGERKDTESQGRAEAGEEEERGGGESWGRGARLRETQQKRKKEEEI